MNRFWDFELTGAPPLLSGSFGHFDVRREGAQMAQRLTALGLTFCLAGLTSLGCGETTTTAPAEEKPRATVERVDFEGKWDGKYRPTRGEPGEGKYEFGKEKDGRWGITVSWVEEKETKSMKVSGERLGPDALRLEGKYGGTTYWYIGRMEGKALVFRYLSVNEKGESGTGVSELTRPK